MTDSVSPETAATGSVTFKRLMAYLKPMKGLFALGVCGHIFYALSTGAMANGVELVVATMQDPDSLKRILLPLGVIGVFLFRGLGIFLGTYYIGKVGRLVVHRVRCQVFDRLVHLPSAFFNKNASGHLVSRITFNTEQISATATKTIEISVREGATIIVLLSSMLYHNWKLTLVFLVSAPFIALIVTVAGKFFRRYSRKIQHSMGGITHVASEAIGGYREVKIFGGEHYEINRFHDSSDNNLIQNLKLLLTQAVSAPVTQLIMSLALALLVYIALGPQFIGNMTEGSFAAFLAAAALIPKPLRQLTNINQVIQRGIAAAEELFALIDEPEEHDTGGKQIDKVAGEVRIEHLNFRYGEDLPYVLKDIQVAVEPGTMVALVGSSGSGKSTLVSLIPRFYDYEEGDILLDGMSLKEYQLTNLRSHVSLVSQQVTLFNDTVAANIAYGSMQGASRDAIELAAKRANAYEFIAALPEGFDTLVGDNGVRLSGGQRQRLAIARALLKDAPILILDEATSALDSESEQQIQSALETVMEGRTSFVIAHRLSTIEKADLILVMEDGRIVERGNHDTLLAQEGRYAALYRLQFEEEGSA